MRIAAEFHLSPKVFDVIAENVEGFKYGVEKIYNDYITIEKKVYGIRVISNIEYIDNWYENIKLSELFGVFTFFLQTPNMSLELRTDKYHEVME